MMKIEPFVFEDYEDSLEEHRAVVASTGAGGGFLYHGSPGEMAGLIGDAVGLGSEGRGASLVETARGDFHKARAFLGSLERPVDDPLSWRKMRSDSTGHSYAPVRWPSVSCGDIGYALPNPLANEANRDSTLKAVWKQYLMDKGTSGMDWGVIHAMINESKWEASRAPGRFWDDGWGPSHHVFLHAMQLIWVYRDLIPSTTECQNVGANIDSKLRDAINGHEYFTFKSVDLDGSVSLEYEDAKRLCPSRFLLRAENSKVTIAKVPITSSSIKINKAVLESLAEMVDVLLFHALRIHIADKKGIYYAGHDIPEGDAIIAGQLALGGVLWIARAILHEMVHTQYRSFWKAAGSLFDYHDAYNCCMQRIALKWHCRVAAVLGAYAADPEAGIDIDRSALELRSGSNGFSGGCEMRYPGRPADSSDFEKTDTWVCG